MMPDSPLGRRVLGVAAVVLVVAGLAAIVVTNGGDDDALTAGAKTTSTVPNPAGGDTTGGADTSAPEAGTDTSAPPASEQPPGTVQGSGNGGGSETTAPPAPPEDGGDLGAPQDPGPVAPPKTGTYVYSFSRKGSGDGGESGEESGEARTIVTDEGDADGERRQSVRQEGEQGSFTSAVGWRADGAYVLSTTFSVGGEEAECDWSPDFKSLGTPLRAGATWSYATSCTVTFQGTPVKIDRKGEFKVVELVRVMVAGEAVDAWKIESIEDTTFGAFGKTHEESTSFFSPRHGLAVKRTTSGSGSGQGRSGTWTEEREIKNLSPQ